MGNVCSVTCAGDHFERELYPTKIATKKEKTKQGTKERETSLVRRGTRGNRLQRRRREGGGGGGGGGGVDSTEKKKLL